MHGFHFSSSFLLRGNSNSSFPLAPSYLNPNPYRCNSNSSFPHRFFLRGLWLPSRPPWTSLMTSPPHGLGVWFLALVAGLLSTLCPCGFFTCDLVLVLEYASPWNFLCCVPTLGLCWWCRYSCWCILWCWDYWYLGFLTLCLILITQT